MMRVNRMLIVLLVGALLLSACAPVQRFAGVPVQPAVPEVLVPGAPIQGAWGLEIGPDGNLYVASYLGRAIVALNPDTGEIVQRFGRAEQVELPVALAFGPDASLYWTSFPGMGVQVGRIAPGGATERVSSLPMGDWPIFFSPDGRLFVGQVFFSDGLYELDPEFNSAPRRMRTPLHNIGAYAFGPDGLTYACDFDNNRVLRFDLLNEDFATEVVVDAVTLPFALAFDAAGQLLLAYSPSPSGDVISRVDLDTGALATVLTTTTGINDLVVDSQGQVYFSDVTDGAIYKLLTDGTVYTLSPGGLTAPGGIAVMPRADGESVYVAGFHQMREYDGATGELLRHEWANGPYPDATITTPHAVAPFGNALLLGSWWNRNIQLWDPVEHKQIRLIEGIDPGPSDMVDFEGAILFTMVGGAQLLRIDPAQDDAPTLASPWYFDNPIGLAAKDGDLYVGEFTAGRVSQVAAAGEFLDKPVVVAKGLAGPEGMDFAPDGRLLVVETKAGRLTAIDLASGEMTTVAEGFGFATDAPMGMPRQWLLNDVAVGPSGAIYVTGDDPAALYRLAPEE